MLLNPHLNELLAPAFDRLESLGIEVNVRFNLPVQRDQLDAFEQEFSLPLPRDVRTFYSWTDGLMITWGGEQRLAGFFELPTLYDLRLHRQRWVNGNMPDHCYTDHLPDVEATELLNRMESWLPFDESGGGDLMCIDCIDGRIVEYDHEWGAPTGRNGTVFAVNLLDYIERNGRCCFYSVWDTRISACVRDGEWYADWEAVDVPSQFLI